MECASGTAYELLSKTFTSHYIITIKRVIVFWGGHIAVHVSCAIMLYCVPCASDKSVSEILQSSTLLTHGILFTYAL